MWLVHCEDLDVGQREPAGVLAADDVQAVGGQHSVELGWHEGVAATTQHASRGTSAPAAAEDIGKDNHPARGKHSGDLGDPCG